MNVIAAFKAFFTVRSAIAEIEKEEQMDSASGKPGWKSTEFWFNIATQAAVIWGAVKGFVPANVAAIVSIAGAAVYTVARTVTKAIADIQSAKSNQPVAAEPVTATATVSTGQ